MGIKIESAETVSFCLVSSTAADCSMARKDEIELVLSTLDSKDFSFDYGVISTTLPEIERASTKKHFDGYNGRLTLTVPLYSSTLRHLESLFVDRPSVGVLSEKDWRSVDICIKELDARPEWHTLLYRVLSLLFTQVDTENCLQLWRVARKYRHPAVHKIERVLTYNLCSSLSTTVDFFRLSRDSLEYLLTRDDLNVTAEEDVAKVIDNYVDALVEREELRPLLYSFVRFSAISNLSSVPHGDLVAEHSDKEASPRRRRDQILMLGGTLNGDYQAAMACLTESGWCSLPRLPIPSPLAYHAAIVVDKVLYILGGSDGEGRNSSRVWKYKEGKGWKICANMNIQRANMGNQVVAMGGKIYVFGGNSEFVTRLASAEVYDPDEDRWTTLLDMPQARADGAACVVGDSIFVSGGLGSRGVLSCIDVFCPLEREWRVAGNLPLQLSGHAMFADNNSVLHIVGGFTGKERLRQVLHRPARGSQLPWTESTPMLAPRTSHSLVRGPARGEITVFGGNGQHGPYAERWDGGCWSAVCSSSFEREGTRVILVPDFASEIVARERRE